jgi:hypothetical protein
VPIYLPARPVGMVEVLTALAMDGEDGRDRASLLRRLDRVYGAQTIEIRADYVARSNAVKSANATEIVEYESVIADWQRERKDRPPGPKAIRSKQRAMRGLFDYLNAGHSDMARVSADDLQRYKRHLLDIADQPRSPNEPRSPNARDHLLEIKALFNVAADNNRKLPAGNPAEKIKLPGKRVDPRRARIAFTDPERALILRKAREAEPIIRIPNLIAGFTGAHTSEIIEASTHDVEVRADGVVIFHIREQYRGENQHLKTVARERSLPLHSAIRDDVVAYRDNIIAEYGHGPLFPMIKLDKDGQRRTYASGEIMDWLRSPDGCGITDRRKDFYTWRKTVRKIGRAHV